MSEDHGAKIVVDAKRMTLGEMAEVAEVAGDSDALGANFRYTAALAWAMQRRTDPTFTYEQALKLTMDDLEIVEPDPEARAATNGGKPQPSRARGTSTRVT